MRARVAETSTVTKLTAAKTIPKQTAAKVDSITFLRKRNPHPIGTRNFLREPTGCPFDFFFFRFPIANVKILRC
jgi:hypothetical protein